MANLVQRARAPLFGSAVTGPKDCSQSSWLASSTCIKSQAGWQGKRCRHQLWTMKSDRRFRGFGLTRKGKNGASGGQRLGALGTLKTAGRLGQKEDLLR